MTFGVRLRLGISHSRRFSAAGCSQWVDRRRVIGTNIWAYLTEDGKWCGFRMPGGPGGALLLVAISIEAR